MVRVRVGEVSFQLDVSDVSTVKVENSCWLLERNIGQILGSNRSLPARVYSHMTSLGVRFEH